MTYLTDEELAMRFGNARPGRQLIAVEKVAFPVTSLRVLVSAQEEKPLPLLDEFLLRSLQIGILEAKRIADLLGLEAHLLEPPIVQHVAVGNIEYDGKSGVAKLTPQGESVANDLRAITPLDIEIPACFDRTIWRVAEYNEVDLISKADARRLGMFVLPAARHSHLGTGDIRVGDLEQLTRGTKGRKRRLQLLSLLRATVSKHRYVEARMLVYAVSGQSDAELVWVVDGEESALHARAIEDLQPQLLTDLIVQQETPGQDLAIVAEQRSQLTEGDSRWLDPLEQQSFLRRSIEQARKRLVIRSSHVTAAVFDSTVLAGLSALLRRGCEVTLRGDWDAALSDEGVVERLRSLHSSNSRMRMETQMGPVTVHLLVCDSQILVTEMPLLGFKGSPDRRVWATNGLLMSGDRIVSDLLTAPGLGG